MVKSHHEGISHIGLIRCASESALEHTKVLLSLLIPVALDQDSVIRKTSSLSDWAERPSKRYCKCGVEWAHEHELTCKDLSELKEHMQFATISQNNAIPLRLRGIELFDSNLASHRRDVWIITHK
jgi:hypothetical protein